VTAARCRSTVASTKKTGPRPGTRSRTGTSRSGSLTESKGKPEAPELGASGFLRKVRTG
jgi:hypothetical protein